MSILIDTGVLLRLFTSSDTACQSVRSVLEHARRKKIRTTSTVQNIAEFWNVSTRPTHARGGYGFSPEVVNIRVRFIERQFHLLTESQSSYLIWRELVAKHRLKGVAVHDARLVATMMSEKIVHIVTLNPGDFQRYAADGVVVVSPEEFSVTF